MVCLDLCENFWDSTPRSGIADALLSTWQVIYICKPQLAYGPSLPILDFLQPGNNLQRMVPSAYSPLGKDSRNLWQGTGVGGGGSLSYFLGIKMT